METWGATVHASPSNLTNVGRAILKRDPKCTGSLGMAISEAVEDAASREDTKYSLSSVLNHVCMHQTIIGLELKKQLEIAGEKPDIIVACVGGGSNFAGFTFPFVQEKMKGGKIRLIAVEPTSCPSLTKGDYRFDYGDTAKLAPISKMYTLGHDFVPPGIHAGGLRYHGASPLVSMLVNKGIVESKSYTQNPCFEAAVLFARTEGFLPAPETSHAIKGAIDEAIKCRETKEAKCIVIGFSGHGHFDLTAYEAYLSGKLEDYEYPEAEIKASLKAMPEITPKI